LSFALAHRRRHPFNSFRRCYCSPHFLAHRRHLPSTSLRLPSPLPPVPLAPSLLQPSTLARCRLRQYHSCRRGCRAYCHLLSCCYLRRCPWAQCHSCHCRPYQRPMGCNAPTAAVVGPSPPSPSAPSPSPPSQVATTIAVTTTAAPSSLIASISFSLLSPPPLTGAAAIVYDRYRICCRIIAITDTASNAITTSSEPTIAIFATLLARRLLLQVRPLRTHTLQCERDTYQCPRLAVPSYRCSRTHSRPAVPADLNSYSNGVALAVGFQTAGQSEHPGWRDTLSARR